MKKIFIAVLFFSFSMSGFAQNKSSAEIVSYDQVQEPPTHKDCEALNDFACSLQKVSAYLTGEFNPKLFGAEKPIINFKMKFIIDENGKVAWVKPLSDSNEINKEVSRLMKNMPAFTPGRHQGKKVSVIYLMPITLKYLYNFPDTYSLSEVDTPPLLKKCKNAEDSKKCFIKELSMTINSKYGFGSVPEGISSASINMLVNEEGEVTQYRVRATSEDFKKGLEKIRKKLPEFDSGATVDGEKVKISLNIPVTVKSARTR